MQEVCWQQWGLTSFEESWQKQEFLFNGIIEKKVQARKEGAEESYQGMHYLITCSHPHVYTLGKSGKEQHLLMSEKALQEKSISVHRINRGGDITYHGPGQLVAYPILDLDFFFTDIHKYLRLLEESIILTMAEYGLSGRRYPGYTGVWLEAEDPIKARKICAMGVRCSRWVTMHGLAFNIDTDLTYFSNIIPCGIEGKQVTSLKNELGFAPDFKEVEAKWIKHFAQLFECKILPEKTLTECAS